MVSRLILILSIFIIAIALPLVAQETEPTPIPEGYTFTDASGTTVELDGPVSRIACVTDICNDILWELGLEPVAVKPNELAFRPEFWGEDAIEFVQIGGSFFEPSLEDIASSNPDLVIGLGGVHDGMREGLSAIAPLYIMNPSVPADSVAYLLDIGRLTDRQQEAATAVARFMARWEAYRSVAPRDVSVALVYASPFGVSVSSHGGGGNPYGDILLSIAEYPFEASESQSEFGTFTIEQLLERDPDIIFAMSADANGLQGAPINEVLADDPLWGQLRAVQNGKVYDVDPVLWAYGRGTRSLSLVLDQAMTILYPDLFPEPLPEIEMTPEAGS